MTLPIWLDFIEQESGGLPVVLVEGQEDVLLIGHFFAQHTIEWNRRLYLAAAGSKQRVIKGIAKYRPDWIGIVDRDEWSPADVQNAAQRNPRLKILPRFCIENYFCVPEELWNALPPPQRRKLGNDSQRLNKPISSALPDWIAHGAMWRVLRQRRQDLLSDLGFPAELESQPVTDEARIRAILETWHNHLEPDQILTTYYTELQKARTNLSEKQLLKEYVHGTKFFNQVVVQHLDQLFAGQGRDYWLQRFRDSNIQPPPDLVDLLEEVLNLL